MSAYPEPHPDSEGFDFDLNLLKEKTIAGSNQCISQFCFSMKDYKKLIDQISKREINNELTAELCPFTISIVFVVWQTDVEYIYQLK